MMLYIVLVSGYDVKNGHIILLVYGACLWSWLKERVGIS